MYNIKINASPFTKEYIKTLRELNDYKINGYLNIFDNGDCPEWVSDISLMKWQRYTLVHSVSHN